MRQVNIKMTEELRTIYKDFNGKPVVPFIYDLLTCPKCYYSSLLTDFDSIYPIKPQYTQKESEYIKNLRVEVLKEQATRKELIANISSVNFDAEKNLETGLAAYMLAIECYKFFDEKKIPDTKRAICSLRAAWLAADLKLDDLKNKYYKLAQKYYSLIANRPDDSEGFKLGPDWGNNFGFEGVRYIDAVLNLRFIDNIKDISKKFEILQNIRATFSKIRGFGKASQTKRGPLLKLSEDMFQKIQPLYDKIKELVDKKITNAENISFNYDNSVSNMTTVTETEQPKTKDNNCEQFAENYDDEATLEFDDEKITEDNILQDIDEQIKKAAIEIVKYAQRVGIKRDTITDIEKILKKYFKN